MFAWLLVGARRGCEVEVGGRGVFVCGGVSAAGAVGRAGNEKSASDGDFLPTARPSAQPVNPTRRLSQSCFSQVTNLRHQLRTYPTCARPTKDGIQPFRPAHLPPFSLSLILARLLILSNLALNVPLLINSHHHPHRPRTPENYLSLAYPQRAPQLANPKRGAALYLVLSPSPRPPPPRLSSDHLNLLDSSDRGQPYPFQLVLLGRADRPPPAPRRARHLH